MSMAPTMSKSIDITAMGLAIKSVEDESAGQPKVVSVAALDMFHPLTLTSAGRPALYNNEVEIYSEDNISLYDHSNKTAHMRGRCSITTHRLFYIEDNKANSPAVAMYLPLEWITRVSKEAGFLARSAKLRLDIASVSPPYISAYLKLSFKDGGRDDFANPLEAALSRKAWHDTQPSHVVDRRLQKRQFNASDAGIAGILRRQQEAQKETLELATSAFSDLTHLMEKAKDMVGLIEKYVEIQKANEAKSEGEGSTGSSKEDDLNKLSSLMLDMGITSPVTRENSGAAYYQQLARQLAEFLSVQLPKHGGIMTLSDIYCVFNRARGVELISPDDLYHAASLQKKLRLGSHLRRFDGGLIVLQSDSHREDRVAERLLAMATTSSLGYITSSDVSLELHISLPLAWEYLKVAEELGKICRDDTFEGINFFPNRFETFAAPGPATVSDESASQQPRMQPAVSNASSVASPTSEHMRRTGSYDNEFTKRASVANIRREVETTTSMFLHRDLDKEVHVFQEEPRLQVLGGRSEDAWPTRYVEYDLELRYKNFTWHVEIPKSAIYGLWFYVKSKMHSINHSRHHSAPQVSQGTSSGGSYTTSNFPQMRKLFLANAEKSISPEMIALIQQYLEAVVKVPALLSSAYVVSMLQVSNSTFCEEEGYTSVREGWLRVRIWLKGNQENVRINRGAVSCDNECFNCMCVIKRVNLKSKKWRWVALKHSCIAVYPSIQKMRWLLTNRGTRTQDTKAAEVFLFDAKFTIERGVQSAGSNTALLVSNSTYVMQLEAKAKQSIVKWANDIRKVAEKSDWSQSHRDESFAIPRFPNQFPSYARWFVDGKDSYGSIYESIRSAKKEIYIAGWWICPSIHLLRPAALYPHSRLDQVLLKKAEEGVEIYILMYKEVSVALTLNSNFSKQTFRRLHPKIHVLRDPDFLMKHLGMWSHHEKIVSVDQKVSFVGGLDLCFGRWDTPNHDLFDHSTERTKFVGKDYSNPRVKDFIDVHLPEKDLIDRDKVPRMPWHDCHCRLEGQPARDVARHFIQRWNYSVSTRSKNEKLHHLVPRKDYPRVLETIQKDSSARLMNRRLRKAVQTVRAIHGLRKTTLAAQREAEESEDREFSSKRSQLNLEIQEANGEETTPKNSPPKSSPAKSSHAPHSPSRAARSSSKDLSEALPSPTRSMDSFTRGFDRDRRLSRMMSDRSTRGNLALDDTGLAVVEDDEAIEEHNSSNAMDKRGFACSCQILRSLSLWSGGCPTERSIQNAYLRLIGSANHFVYIENQFFVSGLDGDPFCSNRIANAIVERIRRAAANQEKFRVMVVMPLLPAFPGKPEDKESSSLRGVMYWQYRSICRGEHSIYHTLFKELEDPFEYIAFYGLRTHELKGEQPQTEEVYVHSKVMIVDDRTCIIGSANINERSMAGDRDSEIAVQVEDTDLDESVKIASNTFSVGKFAHSFRMKLFEEHFGVEPGTAQYDKYRDPMDNDAWFSMQDQAMKNCQIYESVFGCLPSDSVVSFKQISAFIDRNNRESILLGGRSTFLQKGARGRAESSGGTNKDNNSHAPPAGLAPPAGIPPSTSSGAGHAAADPAAGHGNNSANGSNPPTPRGSPGKKYRQQKIAMSPMSDEGDTVVSDTHVSPELSSTGASHARKVSSASSPSAASLHTPQNNQHGNHIMPALARDQSSMFGDGLTVNMREDSQIQKRKEELKEVQGHIVYFPLKFLSEEALEPKLLPAELFHAQMAGETTSRMMSDRSTRGNLALDDTGLAVVEDDEAIEEHNSSNAMDKRGFACSCQILRSLSLWSGGCPTERSIQNAYLRLIGSANHFVYIENQFFVSGLDGDPFCSNRIANAIVERIRRAAANQEKFRVMVVMPLLPAFPGKPEDKESSSLRGVMYWQYRSICRGEHSIYHTLFKELEDPFEYIAFYGLRTHELKGEQPQTEEVYVHSKVMIVDDRTCIIGSANINERSMAGDRDSEIAVQVEDTDLDESVKIASNTFSVGKFAHSFRMKLFEEHFGVEPGTAQYDKYRDPMDNDAWFSMQDQAMKNCQIYESVFGCLPSDSVVSFKQISAFIDRNNRESILLGGRSTFLQKGARGRAESSGGTNKDNNSHAPPAGLAPPAGIPPSTSSGAGHAAADPAAGHGNNSANGSNPPTPRGSPGKKYRQQKIAMSPMSDEGDTVVSDTHVSPELSSTGASHARKVSSASAPSAASLHTPQNNQHGNHITPALARDQSSMFGDGLTVNMREDSQIQKRKEELKEVQGHIVYFPLKFLSEEALEPKLLPAELFQ
ncbi:TPA: hypothetical protein N0F65_012610 [Lagenidium giganteum]|uniref:phospholipase D n=1 Tax=Lagenidium giganteum TaxID=4803 RepID=A0AAV2YRP1_9STRA|nr:TPA: hypothetical protein N0F65_012610 [Lagenidium giganteum]